MWIMLIIVAIICGIIAGMGIGGGSIFILLTTILGIFGQREAQGYNLIMFIIVGITGTIYNIKNKNIEKEKIFKILFPVLIGSMTGNYLLKKIDVGILNKAFYIFMILLGSYEIISSLKKIKNEKNNIK